MIEKTEILSLSKSLNLLPTTIEKDYVLGWILMAIYHSSNMNSTWIFKGGTCLKKCYFEKYRFSEDLDFTLLNPQHIDKVFLKEFLQEISQWIYEESEIAISEKLSTFDIYRNSKNQIMAECKLTFHGPLRQKTNFPRIKLDLTASEQLLLPSEKRVIFHPYSDKPSNLPLATCYCYEELFAEKLRALTERMRPRDLYDIVHLFQQHQLVSSKEILTKTLLQKCQSKQIPFPTLEILEQHAYKPSLPLQWDNMLAHQVSTLDTYDTFWEHLTHIFDWLNSADSMDEK